MRIGIAGAGGMGVHFARSARLMDGLDVVAVADTDALRCAALCQEAEAVGYDSVDDMIERAEIDAIYVALPHHLHDKAVVAAAERQLHVLVDKPLCNTLAEAERMLAARDRAGIVLMVGFSHRFRVEVRVAAEVVRTGELGDVSFASDVIVEAAPDSPDWYWDSPSGGGVLQVQAHHSFDRLAWLMGSDIAEVSCRLAYPPGQAQVESAAAIGLRFANGAVGSVGISMARGYPRSAVMNLLLQGSRGHLLVETGRSTIVESDVRTTRQCQSRDDWMRSEAAEFLAAVREGRPPSVSGEDGLKALRCALAARESAQGGGIPVAVGP